MVNGGTYDIESPQRYNQWAREVLDDIGVDLPRYVRANQANERLYDAMGLRLGYYFDRETWGADRLVTQPRGSGDWPTSFAGDSQPLFTDGYLRPMPLPEEAKRTLQRLQSESQPDPLAGLSQTEKLLRLARMSFEDYLLKVLKLDGKAYWFYRDYGRTVFGTGADVMPALFAWVMGAPGFRA